MSVKATLLRVERAVLRTPPARWTVLGLTTLVGRALWLWGRIRFGALVQNRGIGCVCHWGVQLKSPGNIVLGDGVIIGTNATIGAHSPVRLGNHVRISRDVIIETAGLDFSTARPPYRHISSPIIIEDGVWIGARAIILGGVTIGRNAVIAAGAVVSRSIPAGCVAAGIPARPLSRPVVTDKEFSDADG